MKTIYETGIAVNISNFFTMISRCQGYSLRYNPSNSTIKIVNLQTLGSNANTALTTFDNSKPAYVNAVNARENFLADHKKFSTRILNAVAASTNVQANTVADVKTINRKLQGGRKDKKILNPTPDDAKQISASQQSYTQITESFEKLFALVSSIPTYTPNETDLQVASLNTYLTQLKSANAAVIAATTPMLVAMEARNQVLYAPATGLVDIALEVKKYVKSVKAITLAEYREISGLKFTRPKKKH